MNQRSLWVCRIVTFSIICGFGVAALADETTAAPGTPATPAAATPAATAAASTTPSPPPKYPPYADVIKDFESIDGLFKMHRKGSRLLVELNSGHLNRDFIVLISIAKGIGRGPILGGMSWDFGDDWIWQFRKVGRPHSPRAPQRAVHGRQRRSAREGGQPGLHR